MYLDNMFVCNTHIFADFIYLYKCIAYFCIFVYTHKGFIIVPMFCNYVFYSHTHINNSTDRLVRKTNRQTDK